VTDVNRKKFESSSFRSIYIAPYIKYAINENLIHKLSYSVAYSKKMFWDRERKKWTSTPSNYTTEKNRYVYIPNPEIKKEEYGKYTKCELSSVLKYYGCDNHYDPRYGYDISMTNAYSGLLGNVKYFKTILEGNIYRPITDKITFILNGQAGFIKEISNTRSNDRFTLGGGGTMRGFNSYGIGAREKEASEVIYDILNVKDKEKYTEDGRELYKGEKNSLGSTRYWTVSLMLKAPLSTKEMGINGVAFVDFGSAWGTKYDKKYVDDSSSIRASAGVAIEWVRCPLGMPVSFVFGFALKKKPFDDRQIFTLTGMM